MTEEIAVGSRAASAATPNDTIPNDVRDFLFSLHDAVTSGNQTLLRRLYEVDFNVLTELHYSTGRWPSETVVDELFQSKHKEAASEVVEALYRELYFRHVVSRCLEQVSWNDRVLSNFNYLRLLDFFIKRQQTQPGNKQLPLSLQWQWDLVDEFVYQYQETQRWKVQYAKEIATHATAMTAMHESANAWNGAVVLETLTELIEVSGVRAYLASCQSASTQPPSEPQMPVTLGYFALVSLVRLHVAMADYRQALILASALNLSSDALYWKVPACHITLFYNLAVALMMSRRYQDAQTLLNQILTFLGRSRSYLNTQGYQQEAMVRMADKMFHLVLLCNALTPTVRLDESVHAYINEHLAEKKQRLQMDDEDGYRDIFLKACPKFINPFISAYDDPDDVFAIERDEPQLRQLGIFLKDVSYQTKVFNVRSIAKLYNNLTLEKLASLLHLDSVEGACELVRSEMLSVKNRAQQLVMPNHTPTSILVDGCQRVQIVSDIDIYMDMNIIHVKSLVAPRNYIETFVKQINKTLDLRDILDAVQPSNLAATTSRMTGQLLPSTPSLPQKITV